MINAVAPTRDEAEKALADYQEESGRRAELTGRYVLMARFDSDEPTILYEMKEDDDTAWLAPEGYYAAVSLTEHFED